MDIEQTKQRIKEESRKAMLADYQLIKDKAEEVIAYIYDCIENNRYRKGLSSKFDIPLPELDLSSLSVFGERESKDLVFIIAAASFNGKFFVSVYSERISVDMARDHSPDITFNLNMQSAREIYLCLGHDIISWYYTYSVNSEALKSVDINDHAIEMFRDIAAKEEAEKDSEKERYLKDETAEDQEYTKVDCDYRDDHLPESGSSLLLTGVLCAISFILGVALF